MTVVDERPATGPGLAGVVADLAPAYDAVHSSGSKLEPDLRAEDLDRHRRLQKQYGRASAGRMATLGVVLARLPGVSFEDTADLLGVRDVRLLKLMHGEEQITPQQDKKWLVLAQILENVHRVLDPEATARWLHTAIPALDGQTPLWMVQHNKAERVLAQTQAYLDPSFR